MSRWQDAARAVKRALLSARPYRIRLAGADYAAAYDARNLRDARDYPVLRALARGKRCILDVGANIGATALLMASELAADGILYAFEASEEASRIIDDNAALNGLGDRIEVVNSLVAGASGVVLEFHWSHHSGGASTIAGYLGHTQPMRKVALALDDFARQRSAQPDFLKLDVEGAERSVLEGARELLAAQRPEVVIEIHSWKSTTVPENARGLLSVVKPLGYEMIYLRNRRPIEDPGVLEGRGRCHVLLVAAGRGLPHELDEVDTSGL